MSRAFRTYLIQKTGLKEEEADLLLPSLRTKTFAKGEFLLRQGEICHHTFFIEKGLLRSFTVDASGKEHIIQFAPADWFISDRSSVYFHEPSDLFIEAVEPTEAVLLDQGFIGRASEISRPFRKNNEWLLHNHIRHLQNRVNFLLGAPAEARYLEFVRLYPDLLLRVPQWMVASYLGITPESLSRVRKELAGRNFKQPGKNFRPLS